MRRFLLRSLAFLRSGRADDEFAREVAAHLQLLEDKYTAEGMSAADARFAARRAFGGQLEQTRARHRDARGFRLLDESWLDLKLGARMLVRFPGLTVIAVVALSVAIGAGAAYREFANDLLGSTLPGPDGARIVGIQVWDAATGQPEHRVMRELVEWRGALRTVEHLGASKEFGRNLITDDGRSEPVEGVEISASAFRVLPVQPLLGRPLLDGDERPGAPAVVVIGHSLWQSRFGADPGVVGRAVRLGARSHTVVGVMPAEFGFPVNHNLWAPLRTEGPLTSGEGIPEIRLFGRMAPNVSREAAQAELTSFVAPSPRSASDPRPPLQVRVLPYVESLWAGKDDEGVMERIILNGVNILFVALLGVCGVNVATLVFGRTMMRESEITVRTALGASRTRIVMQLFAEALVLAAIGAGVGLAWSSWAMQWGRHTFLTAAGDGAAVPFWWDDSLSPATYVYAGALALLAAVIVGVLPALKATSAQMQSRLKHATGGGGIRFGGIWTAVIVGQVAVTAVCLLSIVAVAWDFSMNAYSGGDVAFDRSQYLALDLELDDSAAFDREARAARLATLLAELRERLFTEPGAMAITHATFLPGMGHSLFFIEFDGVQPQEAADPYWVRSVSVAANFFDTFEVPLIAGRPFTDSDVALNRRVAIVDETFVREVLDGRSPIGLRVRQPRNAENDTTGPWFEIVGVVKDVATKPRKTHEDAVIYLPIAVENMRVARVGVRVGGDIDGFGSRIRSIAAATDPALQVRSVKRLDQVNAADQLAGSFFMRTLAVVGAILLLLSSAGVYSLLAFAVTRRTREIGVRTAVGADHRRILVEIFGRTFKQVGLGILLGSVPGTAIILVPEITPGAGPGVALTAAAAVASFVLAVALLASVVPARRVLRIQPTEALRAE